MKIHVTQKGHVELTNSLVYLGILFAGFLFVRFGDRILPVIPPCLFRLWTGIPCPSCGATRTGMALSRLYFQEAFLQNPLFFLLYCALILWGMNTLLAVVVRKKVKITLSPGEKKVVQKLLISAVFLNWLYLILTTR